MLLSFKQLVVNATFLLAMSLCFQCLIRRQTFSPNAKVVSKLGRSTRRVVSDLHVILWSLIRAGMNVLSADALRVRKELKQSRLNTPDSLCMLIQFLSANRGIQRLPSKWKLSALEFKLLAMFLYILNIARKKYEKAFGAFWECFNGK